MMKDVTLWLTSGCSLAHIDIYQRGQYLQTISVSWGFFDPPYKQVLFNSISQKITLLRIREGCSTTTPYITIDDVTFEPNPSYSPVGSFDYISIVEPIGAFGWSVDPDNPSGSNFVSCYTDVGTSLERYIGTVVANQPNANATYPGNHGFHMPIPQDLRDGAQHTMNCYGDDLVGGDPRTILPGSPKAFKFNTPIGNFDLINSDGEAIGWALDPDTPNEPILVHFYIDGPAGQGGTLIGDAVANLPRTDPNQNGHGFSYSIPAQYRDGMNHSLYVYGLDKTGDLNKILPGSPKSSNLSPVVQSTEFIELPESLLTENRNAGGGKRIFPDKITPDDQIDRSIVQVKTKLSVPQSNVPIYVSPYDLDEPGTDAQPLDTGGNSDGFDNRGTSIGSIYCSLTPVTVCPATSSGTYYATTDSNGEAVIYFSVRFAHPGDNFAIAASVKETDVTQTVVEGLNIRNYITNKTFQIGTDRTEMLTVWRKLHIEVDSMGIVQGNYNGISSPNQYFVRNRSIPISVVNNLDPGRYQNGRLLVDNNRMLFVDRNDANTIWVHSLGGRIPIYQNYLYTLFDDDDFNSDNYLYGFDADNGDDIVALPDSFDLLQENDDTDCSDNKCNVFAAAYIQPEFEWAEPYNSSNIPFIQNIPNDHDLITQQIESGRYQNSGENDDFWVVYMQISYQGETIEDCDPNEEDCLAGVTPGSIFFVDGVTNEQQVPTGAHGSLVYIETMRDFDNYSRRDFRIRSVPHEIGHQFGIRGDDPTMNFGIMNPSGDLRFVDQHLNMIRWRRKSPGIPRN